MQVCTRCQGFIHTENPRKVIDGKVYHLHCGFKVENEKVKQSTQEGGDQSLSSVEGDSNNM